MVHLTFAHLLLFSKITFLHTREVKLGSFFNMESLNLWRELVSLMTISWNCKTLVDEQTVKPQESPYLFWFQKRWLMLWSFKWLSGSLIALLITWEQKNTNKEIFNRKKPHHNPNLVIKPILKHVWHIKLRWCEAIMW